MNTFALRLEAAAVSTPRFRSIVPAAVLLGLMLSLAPVFPSFWRVFFCAPTAWLASAFLHAPWTPTEDGYLIALPALAVRVTLACSGAQFFCLLWSLMWIASTTAYSRWEFRPGLLVDLARCAALAYGLTLLANTARIVTGWRTALWARRVLPETFHSGVHLATGIVVFVSFLIAGYVLASCIRRQGAVSSSSRVASVSEPSECGSSWLPPFFRPWLRRCKGGS
jgi:exosortase K